MSTPMAVATYFVTWWIVLFAILPFRLRERERGAPHDKFTEASGAPSNPQLPLKFLITTIVASVVFLAIYLVIAFRLIELGEIPLIKS